MSKPEVVILAVVVIIALVGMILFDAQGSDLTGLGFRKKFKKAWKKVEKEVHRTDDNLKDLRDKVSDNLKPKDPDEETVKKVREQIEKSYGSFLQSFSQKVCTYPQSALDLVKSEIRPTISAMVMTTAISMATLTEGPTNMAGVMQKATEITQRRTEPFVEEIALRVFTDSLRNCPPAI